MCLRIEKKHNNTDFQEEKQQRTIKLRKHHCIHKHKNIHVYIKARNRKACKNK